MKLPAPLPGALDDDAASLEASLLEDVAPPPPAKEDHTVAVVCACGAAVAALVFGYSLGFSSPALPGMLGRQFRDVECDANGASAAQASLWSAIINLGAAMGALRTVVLLSLATVVRGDFRVKFEVEVRSGTKEFTVLVHEDWAPSMPPTARTPY